MPEPLALDAAQQFAVDNRSVFVSGGAHGLGLAIASAFVAAGARTFIADLDAFAVDTAVEMLRDAGTCDGARCDVTSSDAVESCVAQAAATLDSLDTVVNCAAIYPVATLEETPDDEFLEVLDVNVAGYRRTIRAALEHLRAAGQRGSVVNLASITLHLGIPPGLSSYITSKGGVVGLTRALARELGPAGVRVNAIAPGAFPTRAEEIIEDRVAYDAQILEAQCLERRGTVTDVAAAALFLASDAAGFVTGQTLNVDGGWTFG